MEKKIFTLITLLVIFVGLPYIIYKGYINHEDSLYPTLKEYASYTTIDKKYDIKLMTYVGLANDDILRLKIYVIDKKNKDTAYFLKNARLSSMGTNIDFSEHKTIVAYDINIIMSSKSKTEMVTVDLKELKIKGQKFRAAF